MIEPMVLKSPRLNLRPLLMEDTNAIVAYRSLLEIARYQSWETFDLADAEQLVASQNGIEPDTPDTWLQLALVLSESGMLIGDCGIHFRKDDYRHVELGITLAPAHQGRGLAAEALTAVLDYVFDRLGKHRVFAVTDAANQKAANLFLRLGFRKEAHFIDHVWFKGAWGSEYLFALLDNEWRDRRTALTASQV